jgi:hypothetical protein
MLFVSSLTAGFKRAAAFLKPSPTPSSGTKTGQKRARDSEAVKDVNDRAPTRVRVNMKGEARTVRQVSVYSLCVCVSTLT